MAKVIVTGSINMDLVARAARLPRPGETVAGSTLERFPGGKGANQAVAAARTGAPTTLLGDVGDDDMGREVVAFLTEAGVDTSAVHAVPHTATGVALIVVDATGENTIVVVPGANAALAPADVARVRVEAGDVVVAPLEIPAATVAAALAHARERGATTILNPTPVPAARDLGALVDLVDILVLNETELAALTARAVTASSPVDDVADAVACLPRAPRVATVVTLGARGALAFTGARRRDLGGHAVRAVDTTGAGDCFVGALAGRLAAGDELEAALEYANLAAAICVERPGAGPSMPGSSEVRDRRP